MKGGVGMVLQLKEEKPFDVEKEVVVDDDDNEEEEEDEEKSHRLEHLLARANGLTSRFRQKSNQERESLSPILSMLASGKRKLESGIIDSNEFRKNLSYPHLPPDRFFRLFAVVMLSSSLSLSRSPPASGSFLASAVGFSSSTTSAAGVRAAPAW